MGCVRGVAVEGPSMTQHMGVMDFSDEEEDDELVQPAMGHLKLMAPHAKTLGWRTRDFGDGEMRALYSNESFQTTAYRLPYRLLPKGFAHRDVGDWVVLNAPVTFLLFSCCVSSLENSKAGRFAVMFVFIHVCGGSNGAVGTHAAVLSARVSALRSHEDTVVRRLPRGAIGVTSHDHRRCR